MEIRTSFNTNFNNNSDYNPSQNSNSKNQLVVYRKEHQNPFKTSNKTNTPSSNPFKIDNFNNFKTVKIPEINKEADSYPLPLSGRNSILKTDASLCFAAVQNGYKVELSESGKQAIQKLKNILSLSKNELTKKERLQQELSSFYRATMGRNVTRGLAFSV